MQYKAVVLFQQSEAEMQSPCRSNPNNNLHVICYSVPVTVAMAPSARIVAYYVMQNSANELVADSLNFNVEGALDNNKVCSMDLLTLPNVKLSSVRMKI